MNQPIRCEPLSFPGVMEKAAGEGMSCTSDAESNFGEVLDAEMESSCPATESHEDDPEQPDEIDALTAYGVGGRIQVVERPMTDTVSGNGENVADPLLADGQTANSSRGQTEIQRTSARAAAESAQENHPSSGQVPALPKIIPAEQKLPPSPPISRPLLEQIASKQPEPAKIARGMVAAQAPLMPTASPAKEEKTQQLGLEHFEATSFEQPIRLENPRRESPPPRQFAGELTPFEAGRHEMPRLDAAAGEIDFQPVRPVDPIAVADAIRTHIELLKTSSAEKLDVVIRPDAQTELRLHVETVNGIVQVQARCDRGDFALLDAHWNIIQNSLAAQGIRLEPLQQGSGTPFQQQSQDFQHFLGRDSREHSREEIFIEQEPSNQKETRPKASRGATARGWQSWA